MVIDDDLGPVGGSRRTEDASDVGGIVALRQARRRHIARHQAKEIVLRIGVGDLGGVGAETHERLAGEQRGAIELLVHERQHG